MSRAGLCRTRQSGDCWTFTRPGLKSLCESHHTQRKPEPLPSSKLNRLCPRPALSLPSSFHVMPLLWPLGPSCRSFNKLAAPASVFTCVVPSAQVPFSPRSFHVLFSFRLCSRVTFTKRSSSTTLSLQCPVSLLLTVSLPLPGFNFLYASVQSLSHVWLCDPMDCSTPGLPVHHQLLELAQTHVH